MEDHEDIDLPEGPDDNLAKALMRERAEILEAELALDEIPQEPDAEPRKKKLKRELRREALARMEEAARTEKDFEAVTEMWDKLEKNEYRRLANHEISRGDVPLEYGSAKDGISFPRPFSSAVRQAQMGDFLEMTFSCLYEMHELIEDNDVSMAVREMKEDHKEILFYYAVRLYSSDRIAAIRGQSDRNIRKVRGTLLNKLRTKLFKVLIDREKRGLPMTTTQRAFMLENEKAALDGSFE